MYLIPIAWLYVAVMMAVAEASSSSGSLLGALITFVLYGLLPVALVVYLMGSPARRRAARKRETAVALAQQPLPVAEPTSKIAASADGAPRQPDLAPGLLGNPDAGGHPAAAAQGDTVAPMRKET